ncbi:unnamed protein product [Angiostrongylus costaricensis]|uniref:CADG domain-containing protein n=1 Tax=Angiostrongylus costaricensis TaxID=334426 RepID=A0A0R3PPI8_ANGCS|nr:unnamed protein product [Angiostrongylus costaricensis]
MRSSVDVTWSATLKNRPALPSWLHIVPSRYKAIAYLVGTPVTAARQVTVHVFAKRLDTYQIKQQYIVISMSEDERYTRTTQQLIDIFVKNVEVETILSNRDGTIGRLEKSLREAFRGKDVNPYIYNIEPEFRVPQGKEHLFRIQKSGSLISIGSQRGFYPNVHKLIRNLRMSPFFCQKQNLVVLNKYFAPTFDVDWCRTRIRNLTMLHNYIDGESRRTLYNTEKIVEFGQVNATPAQPLREVGSIGEGYTFWESVLVFPLIAVFCIVLVLVLSLIFFGRREGQQWRDYKTPKEQLNEYVSVRQSQRHLRELSVQRQLLLMAGDHDHTSPPFGVHSFLQPKCKSAANCSDPGCRLGKSPNKLDSNIVEDTTDILSTNDSVPVGKQTVAEAARQCGSSLHFYRNPLESETDEENDNDSLDEGDITSV